MKIGLVLEGGAKRGIYTAGVLDVLLENGLIADGVIGVSAGAIHGCSYASMQAGRSIRYNMKYGCDYRFMSFKSLFLTGNMVETEFCYHELPEKLDPYDNEAFKRSGIEFFAVCSNVETGQAEYVKCNDMFADIDYIRASASMPLVSQIVEVGGKKLLDGGIADSIPLKAAENLGFEKNIVVLTRPQGYRKKPAHLSWLLSLVYRKYPKFVRACKNRHKEYNKELDYAAAQEKAGKAFVLRPSRLIKIGKMEQNLDIVREMYELGRSDALKVIDKIKEFVGKAK
ncbi:MAG: patatin family protein [Alphaproteobacteria bacterium]|nr:patatin family protein [Alphaproteobacteria bacterium]